MMTCSAPTIICLASACRLSLVRDVIPRQARDFSIFKALMEWCSNIQSALMRSRMKIPIGRASLDSSRLAYACGAQNRDVLDSARFCIGAVLDSLDDNGRRHAASGAHRPQAAV